MHLYKSRFVVHIIRHSGPNTDETYNYNAFDCFKLFFIFPLIFHLSNRLDECSKSSSAFQSQSHQEKKTLVEITKKYR